MAARAAERVVNGFSSNMSGVGRGVWFGRGVCVGVDQSLRPEASSSIGGAPKREREGPAR